MLDAGIGGSIMVMRGDGGATNLAGFRRGPARTLYSGPAASVAGALDQRRLRRDRRGGRGHFHERCRDPQRTAADVIRAGGDACDRHSRSRRPRRRSRGWLDAAGTPPSGVGVGPRSAHIAGLEYSCFAPPEALQDAQAVEVAPSPGDPADYLALVEGGRRYALTNTCAANLLGIVERGDYAAGSQEAARMAFEVAGEYLRLAPEEVARRMLEASGRTVGELVGAAMHDHGLDQPVLVALGGGAGGLGRHVAALCGLDCVVPSDAEVISSIGDAMSLFAPRTSGQWRIRARIGRCTRRGSGAGGRRSRRRARLARCRGGVRRRPQGAARNGQRLTRAQHRGTTGSTPLDEEAVRHLLAGHNAGDAFSVGAYWIAHDESQRPTRVFIFDRFGDPVVDAAGEIVRAGAGSSIRSAVDGAVSRHTRTVGPVRVPPSVWVVTGARLAELSSGDVAAAASALAERGGPSGAAVVVGRS